MNFTALTNQNAERCVTPKIIVVTSIVQGTTADRVDISLSVYDIYTCIMSLRNSHGAFGA